MSSLILKDLLIQKKLVLLSGIYIIAMLLIFQNVAGMESAAGLAVFAVAMVAVTYVLTGNACAYEDKSKADVILNSMPVTRAEIVAARYLSVYVFMAIGVVYYVLITGAINLAHLPVKVPPLSGEGLFVAAFAVTLMNSVYLPTYFKWGYMKSRMISVILFFMFFFGGNTLAEAVYKNQESALIKQLLQSVDAQPDAVLVIGLLFLIMVILYVSYLISLKIYMRREF
ncbi:MAG: ABC-2 transporter permease [Clostridium sp.]|nr:ABC-2 transporter permease [Clostridium sp.]